MKTQRLPSVDHPSRVLLREAKAAFNANPTPAVRAAQHERLADYVRSHPSRRYMLGEFGDFCLARLIIG